MSLLEAEIILERIGRSSRRERRPRLAAQRYFTSRTLAPWPRPATPTGLAMACGPSDRRTGSVLARRRSHRPHPSYVSFQSRSTSTG